MEDQRKSHWEHIYRTRQPHEVSWTQQVPAASLRFIRSFGLPASAAIIDIGGGDSLLADHLLQEGYEDITVLDISARALERAQQRLGSKAGQVKWIVSDITCFTPDRQYAVWHDRATFHFLTTAPQIKAYLDVARQAVKNYLTIGTFSDRGPTKCSGLDIKQYTEPELEAQLAQGFEKLRCITEDHETPFHTLQNFLFCSFKRA